MKKYIGVMIAICMTLGLGIPAEASVNALNISKLDQRIVGDFEVKGDKLYGMGSQDGLVLYDLNTGTLLRDYNAWGRYDELAVSDDEAYVAVIGYNTIESFNEFGEAIESIESLKFGPSVMYNFEGGGDFIPNSSVLILSGDGKLTAYDIKTNEVKWMRGAEAGEVTVSNNYVLVEGEKHARLYSHQGDFVREWQHVNDASLSRNDKIIVGTETTVESYEAKSYAQPATKWQRQAKKLELEASGQFIVLDNELYTFDFKKIYVNANLSEKTIAVTSDGKYLLATDWESTDVHLANGFTERAVSAHIPTAFQKLTAGTTYTASLSVKTASGKTLTVKDGVAWTTNSPAIAYVKDGKIFAKSKGTVTLKASYEGITTQRTVTVLPDPRPTDHSWLLSQKTQMTRGTFIGSPHKLYGNYANVKGAVGVFESTWDFGYKGRHQGDFMYTSTSRPQKINIITMSPSLQKRDITKYEFQKVFGKPRKVYDNYWETFTFTRAGKTLNEFYIQEVVEYKINNKLPMYVFYDSSGRVRYISLYSK